MLFFVVVAASKQVPIQIRNLSPSPVMVSWLGPEKIPQTSKPTKQGETASISSFQGHSFVVEPVDDTNPLCEAWAQAGECAKNPSYMLASCQRSCGKNVTLTVGEFEEFFEIFGGTFRRTGAASKMRDLVNDAFEECGDTCACAEPKVRDKFSAKLAELDLERKLSGQQRNVDVSFKCDEQEQCAVDAAKAASKMHDALNGLREATKKQGDAKRNASCESGQMTPISAEFEWQGRRVQDLFNHWFLPEARISIIDDFVSKEECDAMMSFARPRLARATHARDGDLTHVSNVRDAQQATVRGDGLIFGVQARTVELANSLSNYSLRVEGQENLMAIQYKKGQQYMLHCDGSCDGSPYMPGGRLATTLIYCANADKGGATSFPNANVFVEPRLYSAVYFHFVADNQTENWHTEHSGCPVLEGEKWVVTQWLRDVPPGKSHAHYTPFGAPAR